MRSRNQNTGLAHSGNSSTTVETIEARPPKVRTWPTLFTRRGAAKVDSSMPTE